MRNTIMSVTSAGALLVLVVAVAAVSGLTLGPTQKEECATGKYPPPKTAEYQVPKYVVNLDLPAADRWTHIVKERAKSIVNLLTQFKDFLRALDLQVAEMFINYIDHNFGNLTNTLPEPFADEIKGISKATGIPLGEVLMYNIFYEMFSMCTSIVAEDPAGKLYHARNLDFGLLMGWDIKNHTWVITESLRPMIMNIEFQMKGKVVYKAVTYAGFIGAITGMIPDVLTLSVNTRFSLTGGKIGIIEWLLGDHSSQWVSFLTRDVLTYSTSYQQAKEKLSQVELIAPAYYILGGNYSGQGCVITRSREKALDIWELNPGKGVWYRLQTNYDHWKAPLFVDDRRTPGMRCMNQTTQQNVGFAGLFNVLSTKPVLNKLTTYTALMQVNAGKLETYKQHCDDPCWPW
ncbi:acid ceramidase-like [Lingula anatina]|uniref:Acid ceramidase n=1 Tax=Lingula anatina TaxID=7574 RepID=A0A1S3HJL6_LINAN|nr:acid ceramidase-like [Lingula anatina]|eukprot:XP_013386207.1 acid ceramidase-like [Lingula anatina]